jgi:4-amino-4-deoxy-L-arabinose transferase-like glycosyltransferase
MLSVLFRLFGPHPVVGQIANLGFSCASFLAVYYLARRLTGDEIASRIAVLLLTVYPNQIGYTNLFLSEMFYTSILMWALIFATGNNSLISYIISGLLFGVATLTKTQTVIFPLFLLIFLFVIDCIRNRRIRLTFIRHSLPKFVAINMIMIAVVSIWSYRNFKTFGEFVLVSTNGGVSLLVGNNPSATGGHLFRGQMPDGLLSVPFEERVARQVELDREARRVALAWIKEHPIDFVMLMPRKFFWLWGPDGEGEWGFQAGYAGYDTSRSVFRILRYLNQALYGLVLVFSIFAAWAVFARRVWDFDLLQCLAVPIFVTLISMIFTGQSRYHFPAMPFVMILAAAGVRQAALGPKPLVGPARAR